MYFVFAQCEFIDCVGRRGKVYAPRALSEDFNKLFLRGLVNKSLAWDLVDVIFASRASNMLQVSLRQL